MEGRRLLREQPVGETTGSSRARGKRPPWNGNQLIYIEKPLFNSYLYLACNFLSKGLLVKGGLFNDNSKYRHAATWRKCDRR